MTGAGRPAFGGGDEPDAEERVALVAGGSGGIGSAICQALARDGFDIVLTYRRNAEKAEQTAEMVRELGVKASSHQVDLTDADASSELVRSLPQLDTVVCAAGPAIPVRYVAELSPAQLAAQLGDDTMAAYNLLHPTLGQLRVSRGSIVCLVTTALHRFTPRDLMSAGPKGALEQIVRAIAGEEGKYGVRANCVGVGVIESGLFDTWVATGEYDQNALDAARRATALRRFGSAEELADVVAFLAGPRSAYMTGQTLCVDGGYSI